MALPGDGEPPAGNFNSSSSVNSRVNFFINCGWNDSSTAKRSVVTLGGYIQRLRGVEFKIE
jgi:hypothetical protein